MAATQGPATAILVTGGAGFIGSNFVLGLAAVAPTRLIVNLDKLTYAGNPENLAGLPGGSRHVLCRGDIGDREFVRGLLQEHQPAAIVNFAAESHVDRSIQGPEAFIQANVVGTFRLLDEARGYWKELSPERRNEFRFLHVSTDEVYGSLLPDGAPFVETDTYAPNSPYAASKAASDHLVRSYFHTYGLPTLTTNCSNNYGPFQFPEKLIPLMIHRALQGEHLPVYGDGLNVRDWLYVADHCVAIREVLQRGRPGETYNVGGRCEMRNIDVVKGVCALLDELCPDTAQRPFDRLISFVPDRPGHDRRYAVNSGKIERELGWRAAETFESGLRRTVQWYLENQAWVGNVSSGAYRTWIQQNYGERS